jgi:hypothetical protein
MYKIALFLQIVFVQHLLTKTLLYFFSFFGGLTMQRESVYDRMMNAEKEVANVLKEFGFQ